MYSKARVFTIINPSVLSWKPILRPFKAPISEDETPSQCLYSFNCLRYVGTIRVETRCKDGRCSSSIVVGQDSSECKVASFAYIASGLFVRVLIAADSGSSNPLSLSGDRARHLSLYAAPEDMSHLGPHIWVQRESCNVSWVSGEQCIIQSGNRLACC